MNCFHLNLYKLKISIAENLSKLRFGYDAYSIRNEIHKRQKNCTLKFTEIKRNVCSVKKIVRHVTHLTINHISDKGLYTELL